MSVGCQGVDGGQPCQDAAEVANASGDVQLLQWGKDAAIPGVAVEVLDCGAVVSACSWGRMPGDPRQLLGMGFKKLLVCCYSVQV